MVNYKRVVCVAAVLAAAAAAPAGDCGDRHFDQRQNGSENYRLNIDGVVIAVAPVDSLLAAASDIDINDFLALDLFEPQNPKPPSDDKPLLEPKPQEGKPEESKPEPAKPEAAKPDPAKPVESLLSDVSVNSDVKSLNKEPASRNRDKTQRLKNRLASILMPLLRRARHH